MVADMEEAVVTGVEASIVVGASMVEVALVATGVGTPEDIGVDTLLATVVEFLERIGVYTLGVIGMGTLERIEVAPLEGIEVGTLVVPIVLPHIEAVPLEGIGVVTMVVAIEVFHTEGLMGFMEEDTLVPGVITPIGGFLDFQCLAGLT